MRTVIDKMPKSKENIIFNCGFISNCQYHSIVSNYYANLPSLLGLNVYLILLTSPVSELNISSISRAFKQFSFHYALTLLSS